MTGTTALVSVIVATNRTGRFLREALSSVRMQTHGAVEVVVVDDGSPAPDAIAAVAAEILPHARVLRQERSGPSIARNVGAAQATGQYLAFLDDDDRWHPDRISACVARLDAHPGAVLAYCGMRTIDAHGSTLTAADQIAIADRLDIARRRTGILLPNSVIRTTAFAAVGGFHSRIRLAEDLDLVLRLAEQGPFVFEPQVLVDYRAHDANTTLRHRDLVGGVAEVLRLHRWAAAERQDAVLVDALEESIRKNDRFAWWSAGRAAKAAFTRRRPAAAVAELWWALRTAPRGLPDGLRRRARRSAATVSTAHPGEGAG